MLITSSYFVPFACGTFHLLYFLYYFDKWGGKKRVTFVTWWFSRALLLRICMNAPVPTVMAQLIVTPLVYRLLLCCTQLLAHPVLQRALLSGVVNQSIPGDHLSLRLRTYAYAIAYPSLWELSHVSDRSVQAGLHSMIISSSGTLAFFFFTLHLWHLHLFAVLYLYHYSGKNKIQSCLSLKTQQMRLKVPTKLTLCCISSALSKSCSGFTPSLCNFYRHWQYNVYHSLLKCGRTELPSSVISVGLNWNLL